MTDKLVVNFFGSPNSGKTVAATSLFSKLKKHHLDAVLVSEFAHEKVVEENVRALQNQLYVFANQQYKIFCAHAHARVVVTDSPILLAAIYNQDAIPALHDVIIDQHRHYNNLNILMELDPAHPYAMVGRIHSLTESMTIQNQIVGLLETLDIPYLRYNDSTEDEIVSLVLSSLE